MSDKPKQKQNWLLDTLSGPHDAKGRIEASLTEWQMELLGLVDVSRFMHGTPQLVTMPSQGVLNMKVPVIDSGPDDMFYRQYVPPTGLGFKPRHVLIVWLAPGYQCPDHLRYAKNGNILVPSDAEELTRTEFRRLNTVLASHLKVPFNSIHLPAHDSSHPSALLIMTPARHDEAALTKAKEAIEGASRLHINPDDPACAADNYRGRVQTDKQRKP